MWRKLSHITMLLAEELHIDAEQALDIFYLSNTYTQLTNPKTGLQLMSDRYILENILNEINTNACTSE